MRPLTTSRDSVPTQGTWPDDDVSHVAFTLAAHGADETTTRALLGYWGATGVRSVRRYVNGMTEGDLDNLVGRASAEMARRSTLEHGGYADRRRRDLIHVRTPKRWPWRTSTSQPMGGAVG